MEIEEFVNTLFYGSSNYYAYNSGLGLKETLPKIHKANYWVGFFNNGVNDGW